MARISFFIDGFNLYHALDDVKGYHPFKWLNLRRLSECFTSPNDTLAEVFYFTAYAKWSPSKYNKHKLYIRALLTENVNIVHGVFRRVDKKCRAICKKNYHTFEEKRTDVNIAIKLFETAMEDSWDKAAIVSGDSDLIPALDAIRRKFPAKEVIVVVPIGKRAEELKLSANSYMKLKLKHLKSSRFENAIKLDDTHALECPSSWKCPNQKKEHDD